MKYQENENSSQTNLFGTTNDSTYQDLKIPFCDTWGNLERLKREKEVVGIYISGHPLDDFKREVELFTNGGLHLLSDLYPLVGREMYVAGIVNAVEHLESKNGKGWARFQLEDFNDQFEFRIFGEEYLKFRHFIGINQFVRCKLMVKPGWTNKETGKVGEPRIQFLQFEQLQSTLLNHAKKLTLQVAADQINSDSVALLSDELKPYKGDKTLMVDLIHRDPDIKLTTTSRTLKLDITNELLDLLDEKKWSYRIN